jgi:hypothetical protein
MKLILGENWQDKPLTQLVADHPELRQRSLQQLIAEQEHVHEEPDTLVWRAEVIQSDTSPTAPNDAPANEPQAIEDGAGQQTAEDWLRIYLRDHDGAEHED